MALDGGSQRVLTVGTAAALVAGGFVAGAAVYHVLRRTFDFIAPPRGPHASSRLLLHGDASAAAGDREKGVDGAFFREPRTSGMMPELHEYACRIATRETEAHVNLRRYTEALGPLSTSIATPDEGQFLTWLIEALRARQVVEVGCFTGFSTLCLARGLPPAAEGGLLTTIDLVADHLPEATRQWTLAGVADRIKFRHGRAEEVLRALLDDEGPESYDLALVDADKASLETHFELSLRLVRRGGVVLVNHALCKGRVIDPRLEDADTAAVRAFNLKVRRDDRVEVALAPVADGMLLLLKR